MIKFLVQVFLEIVLSALLFFNAFVLKTPAITITCIYVTLFLIAMSFMVKYKRPYERKNADVIFLVVGLGIALLAFLYLLGFLNGFVLNPNVIYKRYISAGTWISVFLTIIITEMTRYVMTLIVTREEKKYIITKFIMIINFIMIDLIITNSAVSLMGSKELFEFTTTIFITCIAKNLLLNYMSKLYGVKMCLLYRLMSELYIYFIPYTPKINEFIRSVIFVIFPFIVYTILKSINVREKLEPANTIRRSHRLYEGILVLTLGILVMLISREFKYSMIAVGSESMTGTIDKGDAIIYERYDRELRELKEGDIIVFNKNDTMIVHRIVESYTLENETIYRTKGDANESEDNWIVTKDEIVGKVEMKILWLAWPAVLLNELF